MDSASGSSGFHDIEAAMAGARDSDSDVRASAPASVSLLATTITTGSSRSSEVRGPGAAAAESQIGGPETQFAEAGEAEGDEEFKDPLSGRKWLSHLWEGKSQEVKLAGRPERGMLRLTNWQTLQMTRSTKSYLKT